MDLLPSHEELDNTRFRVADKKSMLALIGEFRLIVNKRFKEHCRAVNHWKYFNFFRNQISKSISLLYQWKAQFSSHCAVTTREFTWDYLLDDDQILFCAIRFLLHGPQLSASRLYSWRSPAGGEERLLHQHQQRGRVHSWEHGPGTSTNSILTHCLCPLRWGVIPPSSLYFSACFSDVGPAVNEQSRKLCVWKLSIFRQPAGQVCY